MRWLKAQIGKWAYSAKMWPRRVWLGMFLYKCMSDYDSWHADKAFTPDIGWESHLQWFKQTLRDGSGSRVVAPPIIPVNPGRPPTV